MCISLMNLSVVLGLHVIIVILGKTVIHVRIFMVIESNVTNSFSFVVILVIDGAVVLPGGRFSLTNLGNEGSQSIINELRFHVFIDIHITNRVNSL